MEASRRQADNVGSDPVSAGNPRAIVPTFRELSRVTLARCVDAEDGPVPAGSTGTVVHVWANGAACEVEFTKPFHAIAVVKADDIAA